MGAAVEYLVKMKDGLSGPLSKIAGGSEGAKGALEKLTGAAESATDATKKLGSSLSSLDGLKDAMPDAVKGGFDAIKSAIPEGVESAFGGIGKLIKNPFVIAGAGIMASIAMGMKDSKAKIDYTDLLGLNTGAKVYEDIKKLRVELGGSVVSAAKNLLTAGADKDTISPMLKNIGEVAGGGGEKFDALTEAFTTVQKEGKLTTETLKTMTDNGFKPLALMQTLAGSSDEYWQKQLADGAISMDVLNKALDEGVKAGGIFNGTLAKAAQTPTQKWVTMKAEVEDLAVTIGAKFMPIVDGSVKVLTMSMDYFNKGLDYTVSVFTVLCGWAEKNADILEELTGFVLGAAAAYKAYQIWQVLSYTWMMRETIATTILAGAKTVLGVVTGALTVAQWSLNAAFYASPVGWVVLAIGALVAGVIYAWKNFEGFRKVIYGLWETFKVVFTAIGSLFKSIFSPIGDAIAAIKEGRWADAAKAAGQLALNLSPVGMVVQGVKAFKGADIGGAYKKGEAEGTKSWNKDHEIKVTNDTKKEKTPEELLKDNYKNSKVDSAADDKKDDKEAGAKTEAGLNAVSGGGVKNITVTVGKMIETLEIKIYGGVAEMQTQIERAVEEGMTRAIASATAK
jgi:tape measure domain-containing protein